MNIKTAIIVGLAVSAMAFTGTTALGADRTPPGPRQERLQTGQNQDCPFYGERQGKGGQCDGTGIGQQNRRGKGKGMGQGMGPGRGQGMGKGQGFGGGPRDGMGPRRDGSCGQCLVPGK